MGSGLRSSKKTRKKAIKRRVSYQLSDRLSDKVDKSAQTDHSDGNPAFHGTSLSLSLSLSSIHLYLYVFIVVENRHKIQFRSFGVSEIDSYFNLLIGISANCVFGWRTGYVQLTSCIVAEL